MSTVSINLDMLEKAAERASRVKVELADYADEIPSVVNNPLANLEGGSSDNTTRASSRASAKARSLVSRADDYAALSTRINTFVSAVRAADANVASSIEAITASQVQAKSFWRGTCCCLNAGSSGSSSSSSIGKTLNTMHDATESDYDLRSTAYQTARDFFKRSAS